MNYDWWDGLKAMGIVLDSVNAPEEFCLLVLERLRQQQKKINHSQTIFLKSLSTRYLDNFLVHVSLSLFILAFSIHD